MSTHTPPAAPSAISQGNFTLTPTGYTDIRPSSDSRIVYLDPAKSDANSGLSWAAAVASFARAESLLRDGFPDRIVVKPDVDITPNLPGWMKSGRSPYEPMCILGDPGGPRPRIHTASDSFLNGWTGTPRGFLAFQGLDLDGSAWDGVTGTPAGIGLSGFWHDVFIEDVRTYRLFMGVALDLQWAGGIKVRRSVFSESWKGNTDGHPQGLYLAGALDWLVDGCTFDHCGWRRGFPNPNIDQVFRHGAYIQGGHDPSDPTNCGPGQMLDVIVADTYSDGVQVRPGGDLAGLLSLRNPMGLMKGNTVGRRGTARDLVFVDSRNIVEGVADYSRGHGPQFDQTFVGEDVSGLLLIGPRGVGGGSASPLGVNYAGVSLAHGAANLSFNNCGSYRWAFPAEGPIWPGASGCVQTGCHWDMTPRDARTPARYLQEVLGVTPGADPIDQLMMLARGNCRHSYNTALTRGQIAAWLRNGYQAVGA